MEAFGPCLPNSALGRCKVQTRHWWIDIDFFLWGCQFLKEYLDARPNNSIFYSYWWIIYLLYFMIKLLLHILSLRYELHCNSDYKIIRERVPASPLELVIRVLCWLPGRTDSCPTWSQSPCCPGGGRRTAGRSSAPGPTSSDPATGEITTLTRSKGPYLLATRMGKGGGK